MCACACMCINFISTFSHGVNLGTWDAWYRVQPSLSYPMLINTHPIAADNLSIKTLWLLAKSTVIEILQCVYNHTIVWRSWSCTNWNHMHDFFSVSTFHASYYKFYSNGCKVAKVIRREVCSYNTVRLNKIWIIFNTQEKWNKRGSKYSTYNHAVKENCYSL
jgi:hypothetical protein